MSLSDGLAQKILEGRAIDGVGEEDMDGCHFSWLIYNYLESGSGIPGKHAVKMEETTKCIVEC